MNQLPSQKKRPSEILATVSLVLAILAIPLAFGFDLIAFHNAILTFVGMLIVGSIAFIVLTGLFLISFILIFGFYLVEKEGFWPLKYTLQFFDEMFKDLTITSQEVQLFITLRIVLIVICVALVVTSSIAKVMLDNEKKAGITRPFDSAPGQAKAALVLAIIGIVVSIGAIAITSAMV